MNQQIKETVYAVMGIDETRNRKLPRLRLATMEEVKKFKRLKISKFDQSMKQAKNISNG